MSSDIALSVRGLTKTYRVGDARPSVREVVVARTRAPWRAGRSTHAFTALDDVSFDVGQGEILGIVGRNGAGKSTLLKLLSRVTPPDAGAIDLYGRVGSLLEVGTGFHPELTGRENIYLNGTILGMRRAEIRRRFEDIVEFAEIGSFLDTPVKRYSSGMYVRLAFAVAAHLDSEIMIVDEVLAVGDAAFQSKCLAKIEAIAEAEGRTVLFVSHNLSPVRRLCERVLVLDRGSLAFDGGPQAGIERYLSLLRPKDTSTHSGRWGLTDRENPHRDGELYFTAITTLDSAGCPTRSEVMFEAMTITLETRSLQPFPHSVLGVEIVNEMDQVVAGFTAEYWTLVGPADDDDIRELHLHLPSVPLAPAQYSIRLGVQVTRGGEMLDEVIRAAVFEVTAPGIDRDEWLRTRGEASVVLPHRWEGGASA